MEFSIDPGMRKRLIPLVRKNDADPGSGWLDLYQAACVELTSEAATCIGIAVVTGTVVEMTYAVHNSYIVSRFQALVFTFA